MFDLSPSACTSALHSPNTHGNLWPWPSDTLYDSYFTYRPKSKSSFGATPEMEPTSPLSPASAVTPTASEHTVTPTTPTPAFKLTWPISRTPTAVHGVKLNIVQSPNTRRNTLHIAHAPPGNQTFAERMAHRSSKSLSLTLQQRRAFDLEMTPIKPTQTVPKQRIEDRDVQMLSPPPATPSESMVWEQTTSSRILRRVVGLPQQEDCEMAMRALANNESSHLHDPQTEDTISQPRLQRRESRSPSLSLRRRSHSRQRMSTSNTNEHTRSKSLHRAIRKKLSSYPTKIHVPTARELHLQNTIRHLAIPLVPLISVVTGQAHPDFPRSVLQYHLLTHAQLDSLAIWYHQTIDNEHERYMYPATVSRPWTFSDPKMQAMYGAQSDPECVEVELGVKRRRFGRFIGLRGCESPVAEVFAEGEGEGEEEEGEADSDVDADTDWDIDVDEEVKETLAEKMEREWRAALRRAEEEEMLLEKVWRGRW